MPLLRKALAKVAGNRFMQAALEKTVQTSQYLMGIGAGGGVLSSGEEAIFAVLRQKFSPPYCIFDVGANQGQFLRLALRQLGGAGLSIHCFEPGRATFRILTDTARGDERIKLNNIGLGKESGEATLHFDRAGSGLASLTRRRLDHHGIEFDRSETVAIGTVDNYCAINSIARIHLLKIDIEGHELDVLKGARKMLDSRLIDMVSFEFGGCNIDTRTFFQDFWYFFREVNMNLLRITPSGYLYPIESYKEIHEQFRTMNFIAISK